MTAMTDLDRADSRQLSSRVRWVILGLLGLVFFVSGLQQANLDAPAVDEGVDVSSGVAAWVHRDLRMVPEHPVLPKAIAALPALLAHPIVPEGESWDEVAWFDWSDDFVTANEDAGRLRQTFLLARVAVLVQGLMVAAVLYLLARRWFGPDGGLLAAGAWLTTPYVVGLGHFAMLDVPFTLATVGLALLLTHWWDRPSDRRTIALGLAVGLALATRHTALVLAVWVMVAVIVRLRARPRLAVRSIALVAVVSLIPLWGVYRGLAPAGPAPEAKAHFESLLSYQSGRSPVVKLVSALPFPLEWRAGYASLDYSSVGRPASLAGQAWTGGRWWYFPVAAALKLPATLLIAVGVGWLLALRRAARRRLLVVSTLSPALGLWLVLVVQTMNLGLRLVLPSIALAMVGVGALAEPVRSSLRALPRTFPVPRSMERRAWSALGTVVAVMVVATVQLGSMVLSAPHSLAWSPWPATPPYRWVSDSNVDVGQAVFEVRDWVADHDHPYVAIDATRGLSVGGSSRQLLGADPAAIKGWVAVGVTTIRDTRRRELAWLRAYCPVGSIGGGSVLVYRFDRPPGPAPGPDRPAAPCFGDRWSTRG